MAIRKLLIDDFFETEPFILIGIHCTLEDYRLNYLLNKALDINLRRKLKDIDIEKSEALYPIFEWEDESQLTTWNVVSNSCKLQTQQLALASESLFSSNETQITVQFLVPEYNHVNYLLKINSEMNAIKERAILSQILNIPQVVTAYIIDADQLKSKDNLIFN